MGNRALIQPEGKNIGIYLHWNGGRDSVEAFLKYCELRGFRPFEDSYGFARACQVISNFLGGSLSIGIEDRVNVEDADWMDNGIYIVKGWKIVGRIPEDICEQNVYDLNEMLRDIDAAQPEIDRLGEEFLTGEDVDYADLHAGDEIFVPDANERLRKCMVVAIEGKLAYLASGRYVCSLAPGRTYRRVTEN